MTETHPFKSWEAGYDTFDFFKNPSEQLIET